MKSIGFAIPILAALVSAPAMAATPEPAVLGPDLQNLSILSGAAVTTGALAKVNGNVLAGAALTLGANSSISGNSQVGAAVTKGADASIGGTSSAISAEQTAAMMTQLDAAKATLSAMGTGTALAATMPTSKTFNAGVYSAASWATADGTMLTLDGQNKDNQTWVFNIAGILSTAANSNIELKNAGANSQVFWNTNSYASLGANSTFLGTVLASDYITVGADAVLSNLAVSGCGGLFASTYVTLGAGANVGSGCSAISSITSPVPEPQSYAMLLAGLGLVGTITRRRSKKVA